MSDLPLLRGYPVWHVNNQSSLPSTAQVKNYTTHGILHSSLSLYKLSYNDDSGIYTNTAGNECGNAQVSVNIEVSKSMLKFLCQLFLIIIFYIAPPGCKDPGNLIVPLHDTFITAQGSLIQLRCVFSGDFPVIYFSLSSYWTVNYPAGQQHKELKIFDNSSDHETYRIAVYEDSSCNFTNQLIILSVPLLLNGATLTCIEKLNVAGSTIPHTSSSTTKFGKYTHTTCIATY